MAKGEAKVWFLAPGRGAKLWEDFLEQKVAAIAWDFLGDLNEYETKEQIIEALREEYGADSNPCNNSLACWEFANEVSVGDLIIAKTGRTTLLGAGRVKSDCFHDAERPEYQNCRKVDWLVDGEWKIDSKLTVKTLTDLTPYPDFVRRVLVLMKRNDLIEELFGSEVSIVEEAGAEDVGTSISKTAEPFDREKALASLFMSEETFDNILNQLVRRKNVILQGPPGVGKTFVARTLAYALMGFEDDDRIDMVQFHQSYGYEEFVQGLRPTRTGNYLLRKGVFYLFCEKAHQDSADHFFIIDEINRGNLSKILGELMMLIEREKRSARYALPLAYSDPGSARFFIPPNLHIIGLMNTADRSLAMVDYALRRRFAFIDLKPEFESPKFKNFLREKGMQSDLAESLIAGIGELNRTIAEDQIDLGSGFCIGHSYFCPDGRIPDRDWVEEILDFEILPLLQEYWIETPEKAVREIESLKRRLF